MTTIFMDLETQKMLDEVGGRTGIHLLRVACAVTWSPIRNDFMVYWEKDVPGLLQELLSARRVIGFNIKEFDYEVLKPYAQGIEMKSIPTLDLLESIYFAMGFRVSLDSIARASLGTTKSADGIQSVQWFRDGEMEKVAEYCKSDVEITRRVYEFGRDNGYIYYFSRLGSKQRVKVNWS